MKILQPTQAQCLTSTNIHRLQSSYAVHRRIGLRLIYYQTLVHAGSCLPPQIGYPVSEPEFDSWARFTCCGGGDSTCSSRRIASTGGTAGSSDAVSSGATGTPSVTGSEAEGGSTDGSPARACVAVSPPVKEMRRATDYSLIISTLLTLNWGTDFSLSLPNRHTTQEQSQA